MITAPSATPTFPTPAVGRLLRSWLTDKIEKNGAYSLRAMARNLGVSPGYLSQVMNGQKRLSADRAVQFAQVMKLDQASTEELFFAATVDSVRPGSPSRAVLEQLAEERNTAQTYWPLELARFQALSRWYYVAILDLAETRGFRAEAAWIARRLRISSVQAAEALASLQELGLLVKDGIKWRKENSHVRVAPKHSAAAVREHHKQMIGRALESLEDATSEAFANRSITGLTMAINPERLPEAYAMIDRFRQRLERHLSQGECTEVFQLNVQLFNLSHSPKNRSDS